MQERTQEQVCNRTKLEHSTALAVGTACKYCLTPGTCVLLTRRRTFICSRLCLIPPPRSNMLQSRPSMNAAISTTPLPHASHHTLTCSTNLLTPVPCPTLLTSTPAADAYFTATAYPLLQQSARATSDVHAVCQSHIQGTLRPCHPSLPHSMPQTTPSSACQSHFLQSSSVPIASYLMRLARGRSHQGANGQRWCSQCCGSSTSRAQGRSGQAHSKRDDWIWFSQRLSAQPLPPLFGAVRPCSAAYPLSAGL